MGQSRRTDPRARRAKEQKTTSQASKPSRSPAGRKPATPKPPDAAAAAGTAAALSVLERPKGAASAALRAIMAAPARLNGIRLWRLLDREEKTVAAEVYMRGGATPRKNLVAEVAKSINFMPATVGRWPASKIAQEMWRVPVRDARRAGDLLRGFLGAPHHRAPTRRLTRSLKLKNVEAVLAPSTTVAAATVRRAADAVADEFGEREAVVLFMTLVVLKAPMSATLQDWMRGRAAAQAAGAGAPEEADSPAGDAQEASETPPPAHVAREPGREQTFTTLDRVLVQAAVDARRGIEGALSEDEIDDMVNDYVHLNGRRHRSHFHAGFRDALFGRDPEPEALSAQKAEQARWYWAGATRGWADSDSWRRIVEEYDRQPVVRELGDGSPSSMAAVGVVAKALREQDRAAELAEFVKPGALAAATDLSLYQLLLDAATNLLDEGKAATALPVFELLCKRRQGDAVLELGELKLDARRRRAHCLRHLDQSDRAKRMLSALLNEELAPNVRAMVQADLGLLAGGFRRLSEVRLPERQDSIDRVKQRLQAGRAHFEQSISDSVRYASHGHYCLGVLALCEKQYGKARLRLEQAHDVFSAEGRYDAGLVARSALYLGVATVLEPCEEELSRGARAIEEGLKAGASFPSYFVDDAVAGLELGSRAELQRVSRLLLRHDAPGVFDKLAESAAVKYCEELAPALYGRATEEGVKKTKAVTYLHGALKSCLAGEKKDVETAFEVLDMLEEYAMEGIGRQRFIDLLQRDTYDCPPLETEDARASCASCLVASGDKLSAANVLWPLALQFRARREDFNEISVLESIREYGLEEYKQLVEPRLQDLSRTSAVRESAGEWEDDRKISVLVVGGDERQSKFDDRVRRLVEKERKSVAVQFVRCGWGASAEPLARATKLVQTSDAVVVMRFMRTHFGRHVRTACGKADKPWRFCWGGGRQAQARAVLEAARAARPG